MTLHVVHLDLERGWRGGERQLQYLVEGLSAAGLRQTVVARSGGPLAQRIAAAALPGVTVVEVANRWSAWRRLPSRAPGVIYHAHTGNTIPLATLAGRAPAAAVVTRRLDLPAKPLVFTGALRVVAAVLRRAGVPEARLRRIPSAVDLTRPRREADGRQRRRELGIPEEVVLGLTVGAVTGQKDPLTLVRALPYLPERYHHLWVGTGDLLGRSKLEAERLGVAARCHWAGFDPDPDPWFAAADLFVLPSVHEGLGTVLLDAFHFGLPVVATTIPGVEELIEDGVTAVVAPPRRPELLAAAIRRLLDTPRLVHALVATARRRVAAYGVDRMVTGYLDLYREVAEERGW